MSPSPDHRQLLPTTADSRNMPLDEITKGKNRDRSKHSLKTQKAPIYAGPLLHNHREEALKKERGNRPLHSPKKTLKKEKMNKEWEEGKRWKGEFCRERERTQYSFNYDILILDIGVI